MEESKVREVVISEIALESLEQIYDYGIQTFAYTAATVFIEELYNRINQISTNFLIHPECRFLKTKSGNLPQSHSWQLLSNL